MYSKKVKTPAFGRLSLGLSKANSKAKSLTATATATSVEGGGCTTEMLPAFLPVPPQPSPPPPSSSSSSETSIVDAANPSNILGKTITIDKVENIGVTRPVYKCYFLGDDKNEYSCILSVKLNAMVDCGKIGSNKTIKIIDTAKTMAKHIDDEWIGKNYHVKENKIITLILKVATIETEPKAAITTTPQKIKVEAQTPPPPPSSETLSKKRKTDDSQQNAGSSSLSLLFSSSPVCTAEEIAEKRRQAMERLKNRNTPRKCTPEEIEEKRLQAIERLKNLRKNDN